MSETRPAVGRDPLRRIVVAGGGSAGWMAAAALSRAAPGIPVTLVESEEIGIVGVGEATIPPIKIFIQSTGLDEERFVRATAASFKLGIEFAGWSRDGERYFHPFGGHGIGWDRLPVHQHWLRARAHGDDTPLDDLSMAWAMAGRGRFAHPVRDPRNVASTFDYAYHFDAALFAALLRDHAEAAGVERIEGRIAAVERDAEGGHVAALTLADGRRMDGDLFVDCTGFGSLILGGALDVPFEDWGEWLPCDRAWAVPSANPARIVPFTRSTARDAGWQWRIPLQHRTGNGHVFSSAHMDEEEARRVLLANLEGSPLADPRLLRFRAGRRISPWSGNVVALGLAAGFMEPLESTSLHLVQSGIARLIALFPDRRMEPTARQEFNRLSAEEWERIRDFLILHYHANARDGALWRHARTMRLPDALAWRIEAFRATGRLLSPGPELFLNPSWLAVLIGQGVMPGRYDPLADEGGAVAPARLATLRTAMADAAATMPEHEAWLRRFAAR